MHGKGMIDMEPEPYEHEYLRLQTRLSTRTDLRIAFLMIVIGIVLLNLLG